METLDNPFLASIEEHPDYRALREAILAAHDDPYCGGMKIYVGKIGQDGHDRGQQTICKGLAAYGFDVVRGSLFCTAEEIVHEAIVQHNAHVIGISSLAGGHRLALDVIALLKQNGIGHIPVVVGGVMPSDEAHNLMEQGVQAVFLPGSNMHTDIAPKMFAIASAAIPQITRRHGLNSADKWFTQIVQLRNNKLNL